MRRLCTVLLVISTAADDGTHSFHWVYKMAGMHFKGHTETIDVEKNKRIVVRSVREKDKGLDSVFRWSYSGANGGTNLALEVEYTLPIPLLEKLAEPFLHRLNEREAEMVLANLKSRLELVRRRSARAKRRRLRPAAEAARRTIARGAIPAIARARSG
jgi:hypothetical protein